MQKLQKKVKWKEKNIKINKVENYSENKSF